MRAGARALTALALGAAPALAREAAPARGGYANPSAVIAAEAAFDRLAQEKGQWTAFAATAAPDAVMFVPHMVYAQGWLKGRANPPVAVRWQPHEVWSSCDGSLVVSHGAWQTQTQTRAQGQKPGATGYFTTIWRRQQDGSYKWVLDHGDAVKEPLAAPEMLSALVADCPERKAARSAATPPPGGRAKKAKAAQASALAPLDPARRSGKSDDGSLTWEVTVDVSGARNLSVEWTKDGAVAPVLIEEVAAPQPG